MDRTPTPVPASAAASSARSSLPASPAPSPSAAPAPSPPVEVVTPTRVQERRAFGFLALIALAAIIRLALPVGIGLFLGALLAFTLEPLYARLRQRGGLKAGPAALICSAGAALVIASLVVGLTTLLVTRGIALLGGLREGLAPGGAIRQFAEALLSRLSKFHVDTADLTQRLENEVVSLGSSAAGIAAEIASFTFGGILTLLFMTLTAYFVLRHWTEAVQRTERMLPLERRHTHALLERFRTVGREVLLGTVVTGVVQGLFAAVGFWVTGVPEPAFFGAITALASLIPGIGTILVWVPIGIVQILSHRVASGVAELTYSALTVGIASDYLIRPRLVGRERGVPTILMFVALFGGVGVFGIIGLILGPVIVTLSMAVLKTYESELGSLRQD